MKPYIILFIGILLGVIGQYFFKAGISSTNVEMNSLTNIVRVFLTPKIIIGLAAYGLSTLFYLTSLKSIPQSIAFPALSVGYIIVVLMAWRFFGESLTITKVAGVLVIMFGVGLLFTEAPK